MAYLSLFAAAFLAATVVPAVSEVLFVSLLVEGRDPFLLWAWASAGNTLGSGVNWALARWSLRFRERRWFPIRPAHLERAQAWFRRWGVWTLLLAWLPAAGDALTFVAGLARVRWPVFFALTFVGKATRYAIVLAITTGSLRLLAAG